MYGSLSWIEWLDRLDRVLTNTRQDVAFLSRALTMPSVGAIERSRRQLTGLTNDLRLLDRNVLAATRGAGTSGLADNLQKALDTAVFRLGNLAEIRAAAAPALRERALNAIDLALRDSRYEAAMLLETARRGA